MPAQRAGERGFGEKASSLSAHSSAPARDNVKSLAFFLVSRLDARLRRWKLDFGLPSHGIGREPQIVIAAKDGQITAFKFRGPVEFQEWHKVQVLFKRPAFRCFWGSRRHGRRPNFRQVASIMSA
jgi:hypothetical protein